MNKTVRCTHSMLFTLAVGALALAGCSIAPDADEALGQSTDAVSQGCPDSVPAALQPAADQTLAWIFDADGVQIYSCNAAGSGHAWTFVAPEAELLGPGGQVIGTHYVGPTWEANDGSTVVAARKAGATVDPTAIPWLLLTATSHGEVDGRFSGVTSIQRLDTEGGLAPATGCDAAHVGAVAEVPYFARYAMYKTKAHGSVKQCGQ